MATVSTAKAHWEGSLLEGGGTVELVSSGLGAFDVTWAKRVESGPGGTNPEELIAAAHSACYSMALSHALAGNGTPAASLDTTVEVGFQPGVGITGSKITVVGDVPGLTAEEFQAFAADAKANCPVSKALAIDISLEASFAG